MSSWSKERTLEFIELYRCNECLWKVKSKDYTNKIRREKSYDELTRFVKSFIPDANKDTVVGKIGNLRASFRKENKKIRQSQLSGAEGDDVYQPSLFYFDALRFIAADSKLPRKGRESITADTQSPDNTTQDWSNDDLDMKVDIDEADSVGSQDDHYLNDDQPTTLTIRPSTCTHTPGPSTSISHTVLRNNEAIERKRKRTTSEDNLLLLAYEKLNALGSETASKDQYDAFGQTVANDLRSMSLDQFIHAKKLISDVLYGGQLGQLSTASMVLAVPETNA